jgi:hypothetical protein
MFQTGEVSGPHRVVWCSYITEEESEGEVDDFYDEISRLLAVTRDNKVFQNSSYHINFFYIT